MWYDESSDMLVEHLHMNVTSASSPDGHMTSLLRQNDVVKPFWRNNDVIIPSCVHWAFQQALLSFSERA